MRFLHISDLHIGKRIYGIDLWEDQAHILDQICGMAQEEACDAVLIAGDLYDRAQPSAQAIAMVDGFLSRLSQMGIPVYLVSGNHDNPAQIAYCAGILARGGIYAARVFDGSLQRFCLRDAYGLVNLYALPFVRPSQVRRFFPEAEIKSFEQAVRCILEAADIPVGERTSICGRGQDLRVRGALHRRGGTDSGRAVRTLLLYGAGTSTQPAGAAGRPGALQWVDFEVFL